MEGKKFRHLIPALWEAKNSSLREQTTKFVICGPEDEFLVIDTDTFATLPQEFVIIRAYEKFRRVTW